MGYYIMSYGINTTEILNAFGSMNDGLFNNILETETFELYASQDFAGSLPTKHALKHIIFAEPYVRTSGHSYGYAFIALCAYLGEELPATHEMKFGYETDLVNGYLKSDFNIKLNIEDVLLTGEDPFVLPPITDWPMHGLIKTAGLLLLKEQFASIEITDDMLEELLEEDEEKEMAYDSIKQFKENISYCLNNNLELISFCH